MPKYNDTMFEDDILGTSLMEDVQEGWGHDYDKPCGCKKKAGNPHLVTKPPSVFSSAQPTGRPPDARRARLAALTPQQRQQLLPAVQRTANHPSWIVLHTQFNPGTGLYERTFMPVGGTAKGWTCPTGEACQDGCVCKCSGVDANGNPGTGASCTCECTLTAPEQRALIRILKTGNYTWNGTLPGPPPGAHDLFIDPSPSPPRTADPFARTTADPFASDVFDVFLPLLPPRKNR